MCRENKISVIAELISCKGLGNGSRLAALIQEYRSDPAFLRDEIKAGKIEKITYDEKKAQRFRSQMERFLVAENNFVLLADEDDYPQLMKAIYKGMPYVLFGRGSVECLNSPAIAIVGTRRPSDKKVNFTEKLSADLSEKDYLIVSGGAFGIDAASHRGALSVDAPTAVVCGTGLDFTYPREHARLFSEISETGGVLISELMPAERGAPSTFGARNRIIAALSQAVIVVEGGLESGSLITAREAIKFGRLVFAVPGDPQDERAKGPNALLSAGAVPCLGAESVLGRIKKENSSTLFPSSNLKKPNASINKESLMFTALETNKKSNDNRKSQETDVSGLSENEKKIFFLLSSEPVHVDEISNKIQLSSAEINAALTMLELKGLAKKLSGMLYINPHLR